MVDRFAVILAACGLIDDLGKTAATIDSVHQKTQDASYEASNLSLDLTNLIGLLKDVKEWLDMETDDIHPQLLDNLELCITCCRLFTSVVCFNVEDHDNMLGERSDSNTGPSTKRHKILFPVMLSITQTCLDAFHLLLDIAQCKSESHADSLLASNVTENAMAKLQEDVARAVGRTTATRSLSKSSYFLGLRDRPPSCNVQDYLRMLCELAFERPTTIDIQAKYAQVDAIPDTHERSKLFDRLLQQEQKTLGSVCYLILHWYGGVCGFRTVLSKLEELDITHSNAQTSHRRIISNEVVDGAKFLVRTIEQGDIAEVSEPIRTACATIKGYIEQMEAGNPVLSSAFVGAVEELRQDDRMAKLLEEPNLPGSAASYFDTIGSISSYRHVPAMNDLSNLRGKTTAIKEIRFNSSNIEVHVLHLPRRGERRKYYHYFEDMPVSVFVINLAEYDRALEGSSPPSYELFGAISCFKSIVSSRWTRKSSFILVLNNVDEFEQKIKTSPLELVLPDYTGGSNVCSALDFMLGKFTEVNKPGAMIYPVVTWDGDEKFADRICVALGEIMLRRSIGNGQKFSAPI